jgi:hypothetical protein
MEEARGADPAVTGSGHQLTDVLTPYEHGICQETKRALANFILIAGMPI